MHLNTILTRSAEAALGLQRVDGSMPPGHNGPYHDPETPVRNTAHWLLTFHKVYQITQDERFLQAIQRATRYLCQPDLRPAGGTFICRHQAGKDSCNGLIGQAWAIDALVTAAAYAPDDVDPMRVALAVFHAHPYDTTRHLWQPVEPDGQPLPISRTFNQQLWLAAMAARLGQLVGGEAQQRATDFMDAVHQHLQIYPSGLVYHRLNLPGDPLPIAIKHAIYRFRKAADLQERAIGYHAFNMVGFALLKQHDPNHTFWQTPKFQKVLAYTLTPAFAQAVARNKYGYPYNPAGFEIAFALEVFGGESTRVEQATWINRQLQHSLDPQTFLMTQNAADPPTHAARLYEATRLADIELQWTT